MSDHGITKCSCGAVMMQCRCLGRHTVQVVEKGCLECKQSAPKTRDDDFNQSFDATVWAKAFVERAKKYGPGFATDVGNMIGWFANAIMRGYDEAKRRDECRQKI